MVLISGSFGRPVTYLIEDHRALQHVLGRLLSWDVTPCSMIDKYGRFGGTCSHYIQIINSEDRGSSLLRKPCTYVPAG
jgi:hypothetical protein